MRYAHIIDGKVANVIICHPDVVVSLPGTFILMQNTERCDIGWEYDPVTGFTPQDVPE